MESPVGVKAALLQGLVRGEGYGLELVERVRERTQGKMAIGQGSLYPALRDLEREGLVKGREADPTPERGGRPRVYYKLTAAGQRAAMNDHQVVMGLFGLQEMA